MKTTTSVGRSGTWQVGIARHAGGGDRHGIRLAYTEDEVDLFLIFDGDLVVYLIPQAAVAGRVGICVGPYRRFAVGSVASLAVPALASAGTDGPIEPVFRPPPDAHLSGSTPPHAAAGRPARHRERPRDRSQRPDRPDPESRWTSEELRTVAESPKSWADMLRAFGYHPCSTKPRQALQHAVQRYGIDTSHFVGQRTWSDAALIAAAPTARTWAELCHALGLSADRHYESVRAAARRLGLSLDHLTVGPHAGHESPGADLPARPALSCLSRAAVSIAAAWFLFRGVAVAIPREPEPYDVIVQLAGNLRRIQVKSTISRDRYGSWLARIGHQPDGSPTSADFVAYRADEVDLFFIVDGDLLLYLIPLEATEGKTSLCLRSFAGFIVGDASSLLDCRHPASPQGSGLAAAV